jgi:hypothetical protein
MTDEEPKPVGKVPINYTKSTLCRVVHIDGAWGGVTPQGNVQMALYSEKAGELVPDAGTYEILEGGQLKEKKIASVPTAVTREIEVEVIISADAAKAIRDWIDDKLTAIQAVRASQTKTE